MGPDNGAVNHCTVVVLSGFDYRTAGSFHARKISRICGIGRFTTGKFRESVKHYIMVPIHDMVHIPPKIRKFAKIFCTRKFPVLQYGQMLIETETDSSRVTMNRLLLLRLK